MSCFRFFDSNFIDIDILANADVSSEQAAFPVENAYNSSRRSKVWRSNGYYEVDATNNVIIFRETTLVNLTATIAEGNYSRTAFMAAVKAALEAAGASTYTVTFTSMFKFNIASNLAGGGGIFQLITSSGSFTAEDLLGYDTTDYTGASSYMADSIRIHTSEFIVWDLGIASNPTAFMLIDARNEPIQISPTATITLQGNQTNNFTGTPAFSTTLTYDDRILHYFDDEGLADEALRYWRIKIVDRTNPNGYIQVGAFYLGSHYAPTRGAPQFPFRDTQIDRSNTLYSEGGQTFSEIRPKTASFTTEWFGLTVAEKEEIEFIFEQFGKSIPFFISMDTEVVLGSVQQYYIRYVKFADAPTFEDLRANIWNMDLSFEEQL